MEIQRPAADFRQPRNGDPQHSRAGFVGHRLQRVQRQRQRRAQRQGGQKQHRANRSHTGGGQRLVCAVGLQVGGISGGSLTAPQPFARHRPRRRTGTQPARNKQQPAQNGAACPGKQGKHHDRQQHQPQQQRIGVPYRQQGQNRGDRHRRQQHK